METTRDFLVSSCGHYRLLTLSRFDTLRPGGRKDYQLLYIKNGSGSFSRGGRAFSVSEGGCVLYRPGEPQAYSYLLENRPDVYWLHFSGRRAEELLGGAACETGVFYPGVSGQYSALFEEMIRELQLKRPGFADVCAGLGVQLLSLMGRALAEGEKSCAAGRLQPVLEYFHRHYREDIKIEDCARRYNLSVGWFIRSFKACTGRTPGQYLTEIRMEQAKELIRSSPFNIGEIAAIVGYENPLYFSRIFKKNTGVSPKEYREAAAVILKGEKE